MKRSRTLAAMLVFGLLASLVPIGPGNSVKVADAEPAEPVCDIASAVSLSSPVSHWRMGKEGPIAADESGSNDGVVHGTPVLVDGVDPNDNAMRFDGTDTWIDLGSAHTLRPTRDFSVAGWFRVDEAPTAEAVLIRWRGFGYELSMRPDGPRTATR